MARKRTQHHQRQTNVSASRPALTRFCRRWGIVRLAMFGSVLTPNFRFDSDVDILATFRPDTTHTLLDLVRMERELGSLYNRRVDLGDYEALLHDENILRRQGILSTLQVVYEERPN